MEESGVWEADHIATRPEFATDLIERVAGCIKGGSVFDQSDRVDMACEIIKVIFAAQNSREVVALKEALTALSIIASMGDHHSRKIAMKAIEAIGASDDKN